MREIRTSGSMSGEGKRGGLAVATAPLLDSTENKGSYTLNTGMLMKINEIKCGRYVVVREAPVPADSTIFLV